ncbi:MAG: hypothetical protein SWQ30_13720 [Thermodesulfobacteriota bacterium]|nr:hypothetical protein [Thermodesulfobacteriota bacterium]
MAGKSTHIMAALFVCLFTVAGCATAHKIGADIIGKGRALKKKIAFMPSINDSGFGGDDFQAAAHGQLKKTLSRGCDGIHVMDSREIQRALEEIPHGLSGRIDTLALGNLGRTYGLGGVLEQTIVDMEYITAKRGIWGFRKTRMLARASFRVRCYDTETTAVFFDEMVSDEVGLSEGVWKAAKNTGAYNQEMADAILSKIISKTVKLICKRLAEEPWKGYIIKDSDERFTLSAGKDVGLATGDVLDVFGAAEPLRGQGDKVYLVPGLKIGEIRVTDVKEDQAEVAPVSGRNLEKSHCVKLKP